MDTKTKIGIHLNKYSFVNNEKIIIEITAELDEPYESLQIDLCTAGSADNITEKCLETKPSPIALNTYKLEAVLEQLPIGLYEIRQIVFQTAEMKERISIKQKKFIREIDFDRTCIELIPKDQSERQKNQILEDVLNMEKKIEEQFMSPIDIRPNINFCVFVIVKNLLIGKTRFEHFEMVPIKIGVDLHECTNKFLENNTTTDIILPYLEDNMPALVIHFPNIKATNIDEVLKYCEEKSKNLLLAESLIRNGSGEIFNIVIFNRDSGEANSFMADPSYTGNLLTGVLTGENPEIILKYTDSISKDNTKKFLIELYKQAITEANSDFQYIRFWQILEILAESKNYAKENLKNHEGKDLSKKSTPTKIWEIKSGFAIVYNLLNINGFGNEQLEENVGTWLAFRNAVAHFGSINKWNKLAHPEDRYWAEKGIKKIQPTHDPVLYELKEITNFVLRKELLASTT